MGAECQPMACASQSSMSSWAAAEKLVAWLTTSATALPAHISASAIKSVRLHSSQAVLRHHRRNQCRGR